MNMPEEPDDDLIPNSISTFDEKGELWRVPLKKQLKRGADPKEREEKLAQREAERRERSEEIFAHKRWTREQAVRWIAFRDKHSMERSIRAAVLHDRDADPLRNAAPNSLFTEAVIDNRIKQYRDSGPPWYLSEQVKGAFPPAGLISEGELDKLIRAIVDAEKRVPSQNKCADKVRESYPQVARDRVRKRVAKLYPDMKQGRGSRSKSAK